MAKSSRSKSAVFKRGDQLVEDGIPFYASIPYDLEACCDCALTHRVKYRIEDINGDPIKGAKLKVTVWRAEKETKERRGLPIGMTGRPGFLVDVEHVKRRRK